MIAAKLEEIGIIDDNSYRSFVEEWHGGKRNDSQYISELTTKLGNDNIDNGEFWRHIVDNYQYAICGDMRYDGLTPADVNFVNGRFAFHTGVMSYLQDMIFSRKGDVNLLEIGPGYGAIRNLIKNYDSIDYHAIDVNPLFAEVIKTDGWHIPMAGLFNIVISSNVFQHLSVSQRRSYYKEVFDKLVNGGVFSFTTIVSEANDFLMHYGQVTLLQGLMETLNDLDQVGFKILSTSRRYDNTITVHGLKPAGVT